MVRLVLKETGQELDLMDQSLKLVKQISDIGDVTKVHASYMWSMKFPKSDYNTYIMQGLGLIGDLSRFPYRKQKVVLMDDGIPLVGDGNLIIKETSTEYKGFVQEGIVDFFKDVSDDKISDVIDLTDLDHENTVSNIIDSFGQDTYRYIIANYNGQPLANHLGVTNLNPFALVPSISLQYLWDKIFDHYGWTYSGDLNLYNLWMTYPQAVGYDSSGAVPAWDGERTTQVNYPVSGNGDAFLTFQTLSGSIYASTTNLNTVTILETGVYRVKVRFRGRYVGLLRIENPFGNPYYVPLSFNFYIWININGSNYDGILSDMEPSDPYTDIEFERDIVFQQGDVVKIRLQATYNQNVTPDRFEFREGDFEATTLGVTTVSFSKALIKFKVSDFFKELMIRQGLTAFPDPDNKHIKFISLKNRIKTNLVYDWSDRYVRRKSEKYVYDSYSKKNYMRHKYDNEGDDYNDGVLFVDNENLTEGKDIYKSPTYSPLEELVPYVGDSGTYYVNNFKMFDIEIKEDPDTGDLIANYKPLKNRFHIFQADERLDSIYILENLVYGFPVAVIGGQTFRDLVPDNYEEINQVLNETRVHEIELNLTKWDVATFRLDAVYYFEQEKNYYIPNKLTWDSKGQVHVAEFIRIKR